MYKCVAIFVFIALLFSACRWSIDPRAAFSSQAKQELCTDTTGTPIIVADKETGPITVRKIARACNVELFSLVDQQYQKPYYRPLFPLIDNNKHLWMLFPNGNEKKLYIYSLDGALVHSIAMDGDISTFTYYDNNIYVLTQTRILKITTDSFDSTVLIDNLTAVFALPEPYYLRMLGVQAGFFDLVYSDGPYDTDDNYIVRYYVDEHRRETILEKQPQGINSRLLYIDGEVYFSNRSRLYYTDSKQLKYIPLPELERSGQPYCHIESIACDAINKELHIAWVEVKPSIVTAYYAPHFGIYSLGRKELDIYY